MESFVLLLLLLHCFLLTSANLYGKSNLVVTTDKNHDGDSEMRYFEVKNPIEVGARKPCVVTLLRHEFGSTYNKPPITVNYTPPIKCPHPDTLWKIVLEWEARAAGRQFDRIFGVWIGGVEVLRSCTAEPTTTGIVWTVQKDVTRYQTLLSHNDTVTVYLGNVVDDTYTAVYHVSLKLLFYSYGDYHSPPKLPFSSYSRPHADLILPMSKSLPPAGGLWLEIENSSHTQVKEFSVMKNTYRAVMEIYISFHEKDEFWYTNPSQEYLVANNLTSYPGNGPFREVVVTLDGYVVSALFPFTVIYTGGVNPLLWRPVTGIGSFDLPSYDIDLTPFLGRLLDGRPHSIALSVTNALNIWYLGMNLHQWLDPKRETTSGNLIFHHSPPLLFSSTADFQGLNGKFHTKAERRAVSVGWVRSSFGNITTRSTRTLEYTNSMAFGEDGLMQVTDQTIRTNNTVESVADSGSTPLYYFISVSRYPIRLWTLDRDGGGDGNLVSVAAVELGSEKEEWELGAARAVSTFVNNSQRGEGSMVVKGNLVSKGEGGMKQVYEYRSSRGECYFRNISSFNYTVVYDLETQLCPQNW